MALPLVSISSVKQSEGTGGSSNHLVYEIVLSEAATSPVTLGWRSYPGGTASENDLYHGSQGNTLTIATGQTTAFLSILLLSDSVVEADESVVLELSNVNGAVFARNADRLTATGVILDDDGTGEKRALLVSNAELVEGDTGTQEMAFTVRLSRPAETDLVFDYRTADGTARAGTDYTAANGTLTFLAGQTEASVRVAVNGGTESEAAESFALIVRPQADSASAIASDVAGIEGHGLIIDDDAGDATVPVVSIRNAQLSEGTGGSSNHLVYEIVLSEAATSPVTLGWRSYPGGTASENDLYHGSQGNTLTIATGQTTAFLSILLLSDSVVEADESVVLELSNVNGAVFARNADRLTATGVILDDDGTGEKRALLVSNAELVEGDTGTQEMAFTVRLSRPAETDLVFDYRTADGTARAGTDYTAANGTLTFLAGQTEASVRVAVNGGTESEAAESFALIVRPQADSASAIASDVAGIEGHGLIIDDDAGDATVPVVSIRNAQLSEGTGGSSNHLVYEIVLSEAATSPVTLGWRSYPGGTASENDLYHGSQGNTLTIATGQTTAFLSILLLSDSVVEADESVVLELSNVNGAVFARNADRLTATGVILDDDGTGEKRALLVSNAELVEGDTGTQEMAFTVRLSRPAETDLVFDYRTADGTARAGTDYTAANGTLTFLAGQTEASVRVAVNGGTESEAAESFALIVRPQADSASAIASDVAGIEGHGLIIDDDAGDATVPVVSIRNAQLSEGTGGSSNHLVYEIVLSEAATSPVTLGWRSYPGGTASENDLYHGSQGNTLTIATGQTTAFLSILLLSDSVVEADESVVLELSNVNGAVFARNADRLTATGVILDDDGTGEKRALLVSNAELVEGDTGTQEMAFTVRLSRPAETDLVFDYRTADGTARAGTDYTAANGTLTFLAGQTEASVRVAVNGEYASEGDETFILSFAPTSQVANGENPIEATATILTDDIQNPPIAVEDSYIVSRGSTLNVSTSTGLLSNDSDIEGNDLTALLVNAPSRGALSLNIDGSFSYTPNSGFVGTDSFSYRASDGISSSSPVNVAITVQSTGPGPSPVTGSLTVPDSLNPGGVGFGRFTYVNNSSASLPGSLVFAQATGGGLLADPLTEKFSNGIFLLGLGDGAGPIDSLETGTLDFSTKMADDPRGAMTVSVSLADPSQSIDWTEREAELKPEWLTSTQWHRIFTNFQTEVGTNAAGLIETLTENGHYLTSLGIRGDSAAAALAFELEQAGDFGSLTERSTEGTAGRGWAFLGDVQLEITSNGDVVLSGSTDLGALFTLNAEDSAYYTASASVGRSLDLSGRLFNDALSPRPVFIKNIDGTYAASGNFDGTLTRTADGFQIARTNGDVLVFSQSGKFVSATALNGLETTAAHDAAGRIIGFTGPNGNALTIDRDANGNVLSISDANGRSISLAYTPDGDKLISATSAVGAASFAYDSNGDLSQATAPRGPSIDFSYDIAGRLLSIAVANGIETAAFNYDDLGGYTLTDGAGRTAHIGLVPGGQAAAITDGSGGTTELVYDSQSNLIGMKLPDDSTTALAFDTSGRLTSLTDAEGATLSYSYGDNLNVPASFTDAKGAMRTFTYNNQGELVKAAWADGTHLNFGFNADGQVVSFTNRRGESATYDHDARGRLIAESDGSAGPVSYRHDVAGRLLAATTAEGTTTLSYDAVGRIVEIEYPNGRSLSYTYDAGGRRTSMTDQDGKAQFYQYDAAGRLVNLSNNAGTLVEYSYDAAGSLIREDNGNSTASTYSYDAVGRLKEIINYDAGGNENSHYTYSYDMAGQRVGLETSDGTWAYGYDATGQLTSAHFTSARAGLVNKSIEYAYDAAGNRVSQIEDGLTTLYSTNALNQYKTAGDASFSYDADGNLISKTDTSGTWRYAYDLENRLVSVTAPDGGMTRYEYDVFGNRSAVIENGERTEFLIDPFGLGNVISEYANDGSLISSYAYGLGLASWTANNGSTAFYDIDGVGSVIGVTDSTGFLANRYGYTPFGNELFEQETIANQFEFNGAWGVSEDGNGLNYMRARSYDSGTGKFLSEDPYFMSGDSSNLYRFAVNKPLEYTDISGNSPDRVSDYSAIMSYSNGTTYNFPKPGFISEIPVMGDGYNAAYQNGKLAYIERHNKNNPELAQSEYGLLITQEAYYDAAISLIPFAKTLDKFGWLPLDKWLGSNLEVYESYIYISPDIRALKAPAGSTDGDPHLRTFDGLAYDFQAAGEFTLMRGSDPSLEMQVRQQPWGNRTDVSINTAVALRIGDDVVGVYKDQPNPVNINGEYVPIADGETISVGGGSVYRQGNAYIVTNENGDGFWVGVRPALLYLRTFLSNERMGEISGLLGNHDGDRANEFMLSDGTSLTAPINATDLYGKFADSWRVTPETTLFVYGEGESTDTFTNRDFPARVITINDLSPAARAAAETIVRSVGLTEGTLEFENAVLDVALTGLIEFAQATSELLSANSVSTGLSLNVGGNVHLNEGETFHRQISFSDNGDTGNDDRTYSIDWGDGSAIGRGTIAAHANSFSINHLFADGDVSHHVSITVADGNDDSVTQQFKINVNNVAPVIRLTGAAAAEAGANYVLNLSAVTDPGNDTVSSYIIDWGDGSTAQTVTRTGDVSHTYTDTGERSIEVSLVDEDGVHSNVAAVNVDIHAPATRTVTVGDAPERLSGRGDQWVNAWTHPEVSITHKADYADTLEAWSAAKISSLSSQTLAGGDIYGGDLGVSGQSSSSSAVRREIDGKEALRVDLAEEASAVSLRLSRFFAQDDGGVFAESGRARFLDGEGHVVDEMLFHADSLDGLKEVSFVSDSAFSAIEINAGVYNGTEFIFGGYADLDGTFGSEVTRDISGIQHGSDFMIDSLSFQLSFMGVPAGVDDFV